MWKKKFVYVLNHEKLLSQCTKTVHERTHRNKKLCWRPLPTNFLEQIYPKRVFPI